MKIVCDANMPYALEAFSTLGEVVLKDGRQITADDVRDAEALFTRSTTRVNAQLLGGSAVRFYGSGVIGTDHIDIPYLDAHGIAWTVQMDLLTIDKNFSAVGLQQSVQDVHQG